MGQIKQDKIEIFTVIVQYIAQVLAIAVAIKALTVSPAANLMVILPLIPVSLITIVLFFIPICKRTILPGIGGGIILSLFSYAGIGEYITSSESFNQPATDFIPKAVPIIVISCLILLVFNLIALRDKRKYPAFSNYAIIAALSISLLTTIFFFTFTKWLPAKYLIEPGNIIKMISFSLMTGCSLYIGDHAMPRNKNYPVWPIVSFILVILYVVKLIGVKG